jgi:hypothetical protein
MFREIISPYNPSGAFINFEKQKMIRVLWKEEAPVSGIQVVSHFEVNIHPVLIQLTYEFGKNLAQYLFPGLRGKSSEAKSPTSEGEIFARNSETSRSGSLLAAQVRDLGRLSEGKKSYNSIPSRSSEYSTDTLKSLFNETSSQRGSERLKQMQMRANQNKSFIISKFQEFSIVSLTDDPRRKTLKI